MNTTYDCIAFTILGNYNNTIGCMPITIILKDVPLKTSISKEFGVHIFHSLHSFVYLYINNITII